MKNFKRILLFMLLLNTFLFIGCEDKTRVESSKPQKEVEPPEQIVSLEEAKMMYDNYAARRAPLIQKFEDSINRSRRDTSKFDVARYTYYDYKTIKQYLAYIEQEAAKAGVEISTLRFYYSNYPDKEVFPDGSKIIHPRQNSFFILPTLNQDGEDYGFYTEDIGQEGQKQAVLINGQLDPYKPEGMGMQADHTEKTYAGFMHGSSASSSSTGFGNGSLVLNHGGAAPPPYQ